MANRFWVGSTDSWNGTAGTKWALTSGGSGGQAEPTNADDVFFDGASGAVTVSIAVQSPSCHNLDFTGFTGTFDTSGGAIGEIAGSLTLGSGMTWATATSSGITFTSTSAATITSNGITMTAGNVTFNGAGGTWTLQDNLVIAAGTGATNRINVTQGTFDANNHNATIAGLASTGSSTRQLNFGTGTWTITQNSGTMWNVSSTGLTWNNGGGTVVFAPTAILPKITAHPANFTFNNVWLKNTYRETFNFSAGITIDGNFKVDPGCFFICGSGTGMLNISASLTMKGTPSGGYIDTTADFGANATTVYDCDYLILKNSDASNNSSFTSTFYAGSHSVNNGNNTGWIFADATLLTNNDNTISNPLIPQLVIV